MQKRKCEYCGTEYEPKANRQRFCSDYCRARSFKDKQLKLRKEAKRAYIESIRTLQAPKYKGMDASDPRCKLARLKSKGIKSEEYWDLFRECDLMYCGGTASVNGISTELPHFVEAVLLSIEELGIVVITSSSGKGES